jgi:hypothetical protein
MGSLGADDAGYTCKCQSESKLTGLASSPSSYLPVLGRRAARLADEVARRKPRRVALVSLLLFRFAAAAFLVLRATLLLFLTSFLPLRSTVCATLLRVRAFCAASAFAAIVPSADPIDSATLIKSAPSLVRLPVRAFIC